MIEYLLKRTDGDWFRIGDFKAVCQPRTIPFEQVDGWGNARIRIGSCEVAFSDEIAGIQVSFEGEIAEQLARQVVAEVLERITATSGQTGEIVQISW